MVEQLKDWPGSAGPYEVVTAAQFLSSPELGAAPGTKLVNLCRSYKY